MLGAGKKKPGLVIAIGGGKPKGDSMPPDDMGELDGERRTVAGEALAKAIKSGDGAAVADAFSELMACCDDVSEEPEEPEDEIA